MVTVLPDRGIGLSLGAVDVLTKPVDRARLTALIHRLVRRDGPVLIVEDDADTRDMMRHTIEKMGLPVAEAADGRQALAWLGDASGASDDPARLDDAGNGWVRGSSTHLPRARIGAKSR